MENQKNKIRTGLVVFLICTMSQAGIYEYKNGLKLQALDYNAAAKQCFKVLTHNKYPGEEKGLDIIDVCANPVKGNVK